MSEINQTSIQAIAETFAYVPLVQLAENEAFLSAVTGTGVNKANTLTRRFTFRKPRLEITTPTQEIVKIDMVYGFNSRTTLYTLERNVVVPTEVQLLYISSRDGSLFDLEDRINDLFGIKGWSFPDDIRYNTFSQYMTDKQYSFDIQVEVDVLSTYGKMTLNVVLDYMLFDDAVDALVSDLKYADTAYTFSKDELYHIQGDLAVQYRQYMNNLRSNKV